MNREFVILCDYTIKIIHRRATVIDYMGLDQGSGKPMVKSKLGYLLLDSMSLENL